MPTLHVCSLARLHDTVATTGASHIVTLINDTHLVRRPECVAEHCHLVVAVGDIVEAAEGQVLPGAEHVEELLAFVRRWGRESPLVIHCYAGISRSTAAAFVSACALAPQRSEDEVAQALRQASPTATPNRRIVAVADDILGRRGRMVDAVARIGRGRDAFEGEPFALRLA
jgi:predicted protein tyrosine phosphatase